MNCVKRKTLSFITESIGRRSCSTFNLSRIYSVVSSCVTSIMAETKQILLILCLNIFASSAEESTEESTDAKSCNAAKNVFAEKTIEFEVCAMQHAISNDLCSNCIVTYVEQFHAYDQLLKTLIISQSNKSESCGDMLNEEDRFNIFRTQYARTRDQWHSARCSSMLWIWLRLSDPQKNDHILLIYIQIVLPAIQRRSRWTATLAHCALFRQPQWNWRIWHCLCGPVFRTKRVMLALIARITL